MYYYRARYYDLESGRFISEDPIRFSAGDTNLYRYVGNNPISYFDPFGLFSCQDKNDTYLEIAKWLHLANQKINEVGGNGSIDPYFLAWSLAKQSRDTLGHKSTDIEAAAEHYLYSRQSVETSTGMMKYIFRSRLYWGAQGYYVKKKLFSQSGNQTPVLVIFIGSKECERFALYLE